MDVYEGKENYIFISYAHKDSAVVVPILETMMKHGFRLWYDLGIEAGTEWPEYIAEHLQGSRTVISFMSNHASNSRNCRNEINEALSLDKDTLVIYLSETQLTPGMRLQLNSTQSMFYYHHESMDSFIEALLKARILKDCRGSAPSAAPSVGIPYQAPAAPAAPTPAPAPTPTPTPAVTATPVKPAVIATEPRKPAVTATETMPRATQFSHKQEENDKLDLSADQLYQVGRSYAEGLDTPRDYAEAECWYRMAYKKGSAEAANALGELYCKGVFIGVPEYVKGIAWFRKAIDLNGLPAAYRNLGKCYSNGYGVQPDAAAAFDCKAKGAVSFGKRIGGALKSFGDALTGKRRRAFKKVNKALK
ncbi:MAG: toll/interleukin-1 receptor domain-containing protein [Clostridia bacterium]|nr:toll/interleukin-1 receptor domain-containing protein [Clostridia bacterium]